MDDASIEPPSGEGHNCSQCGAALDAGDRFCRICGLEQRTYAATITALVARILPERIDAALKDRIREQKVVEIETAELLAERAMKWLKALGFFLGIPILLIVAIFSYFGINVWSDLQGVASKTLDLQRSLTEPQQRLAVASQQIQQLQANLEGAKQQLQANLEDAKKALTTQISQVAAQQDCLEQQLNVIRRRLGSSPGEKLADALSRFNVWLQGIGFGDLGDRITVCIFSKDSPLPGDLSSLSSEPNSLYLNNTLYIHKALSEDVSVVLREYSHHALTKSVGTGAFQQTEIKSAVADYLPAAF